MPPKIHMYVQTHFGSSSRKNYDPNTRVIADARWADESDSENKVTLHRTFINPSRVDHQVGSSAECDYSTVAAENFLKKLDENKLDNNYNNNDNNVILITIMILII